LRGGFYLFFGEEAGLARAPVGGKAGDDNREPTQIIEDLGTIEAGLHQLAQAIYDRRKNLAVRLRPRGVVARDRATAPAEDNKLTDPKLRVWLSDAVAEAETDRKGDDDSARARVAQDALKLLARTGELEALVDRIAGHADIVEGEEPKP